MTLKEFLDKNPIIKEAELARQTWPTISNAPQKLNNKKHEVPNKSGKQRVRDEDIEDVIKVLQKLSDNIQEFKEKQNPQP